MVEYALNLDGIFQSLSDSTRRDILRRLIKHHLSVSQIAEHYDISFAGISKHLKVLEKARLIIKHRHGKEQIVSVNPLAMKDAVKYLSHYQTVWNQQLDSLDKYLKSVKNI